METKQTQPEELKTPKKHYSSPKLLVYGDLRDLTLAPSPGGFVESGYGHGKIRKYP